MPSDTVASNYFRSKKYIGSKERRFISETVFLTLRNKFLCEYCFENSFSTINNYSDVSKPETEKDEFGLVLTAFYLASKYSIDKYFSAEDLYNALPERNENDFYHSLKNSLVEHYETNFESAIVFFNRVDEVFLGLENDISEKMTFILRQAQDDRKREAQDDRKREAQDD
ncbi:hypothetical protein D9V86_05115, partial [Bacteroidetes/Chlorobi group bacterium ChocPot_Mid]